MIRGDGWIAEALKFINVAIISTFTTEWALSRNQVKLSFFLAIDCLIPDIIANVVA